MVVQPDDIEDAAAPAKAPSATAEPEDLTAEAELGEPEAGEAAEVAVGPGPRRILAVGSGKGGVGKSLLAANLGIFLAQLGRRVVLVDADLGGANLHTFVGLDRPEVTLGDFFDKRIPTVAGCVVETGIKNLGLVSAEGDPLWAATPRPSTRNRLIAQLRTIECDYLICDLPPGSGFTALDFFLAADLGLLVVIPEPTSIENTFRFIKSAFLRRLRTVPGADRLPTSDRSCAGGIPAPLDLYQAAKALDPALGERILDEIYRFRPRLVVNQTRARSDLELGAQLRAAGRRRLGLALEHLGNLESDDAASVAVRRRRPLVVEHPEAKVTKNLEKVVRRVLAVESEKPLPRRPPRATEEQTLYEVLELDPGAADEEIRRAHKRLRELYAADSMIICGLYAPERLEVVQRRLQDAYDTLLDPEARRAYDLELFPDGIPVRPPPSLGERRPAPALQPPPKPEEIVPRPPEPTLTAETEYSGELLKRVRESRGIELADIAQRTKIGITHLRSIEAERWEALPAPVYLRGFVVELARYLRLDGGQVVRTYLDRYRRARASDAQE